MSSYTNVPMLYGKYRYITANWHVSKLISVSHFSSTTDVH